MCVFSDGPETATDLYTVRGPLLQPRSKRWECLHITVTSLFCLDVSLRWACRKMLRSRWWLAPEREDYREGLFYLNDVIDQGSTSASPSAVDNGKDRKSHLCIQLPSSHTVFQMNWCVNTEGLAGCLLCRDWALPLPPLTLPPLLLFFSSLFIQRGTSASMPTPNSAGSASRLGLNVAGVQTRYVDPSSNRCWEIQFDTFSLKALVSIYRNFPTIRRTK